MSRLGNRRIYFIRKNSAVITKKKKKKERKGIFRGCRRGVFQRVIIFGFVRYCITEIQLIFKFFYIFALKNAFANNNKMIINNNKIINSNKPLKKIEPLEFFYIFCFWNRLVFKILIVITKLSKFGIFQ